MRQGIRLLVLSVTTISFISQVSAADADVRAGQVLHDAHCIACHAALTQGKPTRIYTRSQRQVNSYAELVKQVQRCQMSSGLAWSAATIDDVAAFLNRRYYQF